MRWLSKDFGYPTSPGEYAKENAVAHAILEAMTKPISIDDLPKCHWWDANDIPEEEVLTLGHIQAGENCAVDNGRFLTEPQAQEYVDAINHTVPRLMEVIGVQEKKIAALREALSMYSSREQFPFCDGRSYSLWEERHDAIFAFYHPTRRNGKFWVIHDEPWSIADKALEASK